MICRQKTKRVLAMVDIEEQFQECTTVNAKFMRQNCPWHVEQQ